MRKFLAMSILAAGFTVIPLQAQSSGAIRDAQQVLKDKGLYTGMVDGIYGPKTRSAVRAFQKQQNLTADGRLGPETLSSLGVKEAAPTTEFEKAGTQLKNSYTKGGKHLGEGGKQFGTEISHGHVVEAGKNLGTEVGKGAKKIGVGTGHAAESAAKGVKNSVTGDHSKDTNSH
jgi:lysozyme family protein